jgi:capsular polysaccharide export protein
VAGLRRGAVDPAQALRHADRIVTTVGIAELLERVDALETMTSLAGFEALLRGVRVAAHGRPFYAGWGLTEDLDPPPRRDRRLSLDELVAGALILYPRYLDPVTGLRCPPEVLVRRLAAARDAARERSPSARAAQMAYARARHALLTPIGRALRRWRGAVRTRPGDPAPPA